MNFNIPTILSKIDKNPDFLPFFEYPILGCISLWDLKEPIKTQIYDLKRKPNFFKWNHFKLEILKKTPLIINNKNFDSITFVQTGI